MKPLGHKPADLGATNPSLSPQTPNAHAPFRRSPDHPARPCDRPCGQGTLLRAAYENSPLQGAGHPGRPLREGVAVGRIVLRVPGQDHPWVVLTDEAPDDVDLGAYGLRVWIEQGFRTLKRMGWQWHRTRRLDPARVDRHWLVLAVATLWVLAHGTRVEEARLRGRAPGRVRRPPPEPATAGPGAPADGTGWPSRRARPARAPSACPGTAGPRRYIYLSRHTTPDKGIILMGKPAFGDTAYLASVQAHVHLPPPAVRSRGQGRQVSIAGGRIDFPATPPPDPLPIR